MDILVSRIWFNTKSVVKTLNGIFCRSLRGGHLSVAMAFHNIANKQIF